MRKYEICCGILSEAEDDIRNAKSWYKKQKAGLELRFASELKQTIRYIIDQPLLFEVKYKNTRVAYTKVFPFGIHYTFDDDTKITILAVLHTSKNLEI